MSGVLFLVAELDVPLRWVLNCCRLWRRKRLLPGRVEDIVLQHSYAATPTGVATTHVGEYNLRC